MLRENLELTIYDYETIARRLIHSNWQERQTKDGQAEIILNYGPMRYVWRGSNKESSVNIIDWFFNRIVK